MHLIRISDIVTIDDKTDIDTFINLYTEWLVSKGWSGGGTFYECDEDGKRLPPKKRECV